MDNPSSTNGTSNYNSILPHSQSELGQKHSKNLNAQNSVPVNDRDVLGVNPARNTWLDSQFTSAKVASLGFQKIHLDYLQGYTKVIHPEDLRCFLASHFKNISLSTTE